MAMTGVLRPGHAQLRVLDLEESVQWYTDVMGLVPMGRDSALDQSIGAFRKTRH